MLINLNDELQYNNAIQFRNQEDDVKKFIQNIIHTKGFFVMPLKDREFVAINGQFDINKTLISGDCKTIFDIWARPVELEIHHDGYIITVYRDYIEKSTTWRMSKELITLNIKS